MPDAISLLKARLGSDRIVADPSGLKAYEIGGSRPAVALFPSNPDEAALALGEAGKAGLPVVPWGAGTKQYLGPPPSAGFAVLCTRRLNSVIDFDPENLTITAAAGASLSSIQDTVRHAGLMVPLDPPYSDRATIGGILASGSSGPRRLMYGSTRDLTLGLRAALPGGQVIKAGGKTVKNVAGYDVTKLFVGSMGTLGLIIEATMRLRPIPEARCTLILPCQDLQGIENIVKSVLASTQFAPSALEVISPGAIAMVRDATELELDEGYLLVVGLEGLAEEVWSQSSRLGTLGSFQELVETDRLWHILRDGLPGGVAARAGLPLTSIWPFLRGIEAAVSSVDVECPVIVRAGTGLAHLFPRAPEESPDALVGFLRRARSLATELGGYLVPERGPAHVRSEMAVWDDAGGSLPVAKRIKEVFDPKHIMSPGRFAGGL